MRIDGDNMNLRINGHHLGNFDFLKLIDEEQMAPSLETPMRADADVLDEKSKIELIERHFEEIMKILGLDLTDDSLKGTPHRVAKMYVREIFSGLNKKNKPDIRLFENKFGYNQMLVEKDIKVYSYCEHHFVPIIGKAHVGYISNGKIIGLSKINRIVEYFAKRPQVQERLTMQIADELKRILKTDDVAVMIEAAHMCVMIRGIEDEHSLTTTSSFHGKFKENEYRLEFLNYINSSTRLIN